MLWITSLQLARFRSLPSMGPLQIGVGALRVEVLRDAFVEKRRLDGSLSFDASRS